jgi:hypothetical protein
VTTLYATPKEGQSVRSPDHGGQYLPAEGAFVAPSAYWTRRETDGDVTLSVDAPKKRAPQTKEA